MLFQRRTDMIRPEEALPGRSQPMPVDGTHVVLGTSTLAPWPEGSQVIYLAMGCFWGAERILWQLPGVVTTAVGYMGGWTPHPTYEETCTSQTGHTESVMVVYDPSILSVDTIMQAFWENHDPTTPNRQGNDIGTQYRSAIFTTSDMQRGEVDLSRERYQRALESAGYGSISTQICSAEEAGDGVFYYAEDYHQGYLHKNPGGYCNHGFCQIGYSAN